MKGTVIQIQNFSVNDGDGIRTTVFFAGCPLHCQWCANPEGFTMQKKVAFYERNCVACGRCVAVCPEKIGINLNRERRKCIACGNCVTVCPKGARKILTEEKSTEEIISVIKPQIPFYRKSGGGVTFSGGEATMQKEFLQELASRLYDMGIHLALETSGFFVFDEVKEILELMDLIFVDIKHMDSKKHHYFTGVENERILQNIAIFHDLSAEVVVRIPVIEGVNADDENIKATAAFVSQNLPKAKIELLPYHTYGESKYEALGMVCPPDSFKTPSMERMEQLENLVRSMGVEIIQYR